MKNLGFTRICREIADVAIYAHYPESFCSENLAIRKVFAFSDSVAVEITPRITPVDMSTVLARTPIIWLARIPVGEDDTFAS